MAAGDKLFTIYRHQSGAYYIPTRETASHQFGVSFCNDDQWLWSIKLSEDDSIGTELCSLKELAEILDEIKL